MTHTGPLALALLLSMAACRPFSEASEPAPVPAIAPATAGARVAPIATADGGLPTLVSFPRPSKDAQWLAAIPHARRFRRLTLQGVGTLRLGWVREAEHVDETTGTTLAPVRLVVERDGNSAAVAFGDLYGDVEPGTLSFCARAGYRSWDGSRLETPRIQGFVSGASIGNTTGDQEVLVVLAGVTLHVLERQTSDGMCAFQTRQGPMTVCRGEEYERIAEIRLATPPTSFEESVASTTETEPGTLTTHPLDCAGATPPLLPPT